MNTICKLTFGSLCNMYGVNVLMLTAASSVNALDIWDMIVGNATRETAHLILCAFNELCSTSYTVDDILVNLLENGN
ncbi:MAG TPA: hypothetical protein VFB12_29920 [Ktedonobacteraceae bacterium]|nr:hypothetical protein [Ktedonobacteraceae bacterium]